MGVAAIGLGFCGLLSYSEGYVLASIIAVITVLVLFVAIIVSLWKFSKVEPRIVINRDGVGAANSKDSLIPWEDIDEVVIGRLHLSFA
jgi:hypothetical protein